MLCFRLKASTCFRVITVLSLWVVSVYRLVFIRSSGVSKLDSEPDKFPFLGFWSLDPLLLVIFFCSGLLKFHWLPPSCQAQDLCPGCWVRTWLWSRVAEENLFPQSEQRRAEVEPLGGDDGEEVSAAAFSAMWVWRWAFRRDIRLNLRPHSSHSDQTLRLFFCTQEEKQQLTSEHKVTA